MSLAVAWPWSTVGEDPSVYLDDVYRYARARLRSREDAEDVACEVVESLPCPCRRRDLKIYMIGMARRKVADRLRRSRPTVDLGEADLTTEFAKTADQNAQIEATLAALTEDQREALTLKYIVGMTSEEIGTVLGRSAEAVDSLLQRARAGFARQWDASSSQGVNR